MPLSDEEINQIWSTQGDTPYRPSIVYEMSLTPIVPEALAPGPRLVGAIGAVARARGGRHDPFTGVAYGPPVPAMTVAIDDPAWAPALAFVPTMRSTASLAFDVDSRRSPPSRRRSGWRAIRTTTVQLVWESLAAGPAGSRSGRRRMRAARRGDRPGRDPDQRRRLPDRGAAAGGPRRRPAVAGSCCYARRSFTRCGGGPSKTVRSAPLLVTLYRS